MPADLPPNHAPDHGTANPPIRPEDDLPEPPLRRRFTSAQWIVLGLCLASWAISATGYHILMFAGMGHSSLLFMGIPTVLAIVLCFAPPSQSVTGGIMKSITFAILIIAPLLGEGYLCILFASPIFYLVGFIIGSVVDSYDRKTTTLSCIAVLMIPLCLEGVTPRWTFQRTQTVEATSIVTASASAVEQALGHTLNVDSPLPRFLSIGFPRPLEAHGEGLSPGDTRTIHFSGAEGDPAGDLVMRVAAHQPGSIRFETVSDASKLTQWVAWRSSEVQWQAIDATHTRVTWRIRFDRQLDPAWYFAPWERFAVRDAARYLIQASATPTQAAP